MSHWTTAQDSKAYRQHRGNYDPKVWSTITESCLPKRRCSMLDVGCGTGQVLEMLAPFFEHAFGVDLSESQIEEAKENPELKALLLHHVPPHAEGGKEEEEKTENKNGDKSSRLKTLDFIVGPAESFPFPPPPPVQTKNSEEEKEEEGKSTSSSDGGVDLVTVASALHWFNIEAFVSHLDKVLAPGGRLIFWTPISRRSIDAATEAGQAFTEALDTVAKFEGAVPAEIRHIDAEYAEMIPILSQKLNLVKKETVLMSRKGIPIQHVIGFVSTTSVFQNYEKLRNAQKGKSESQSGSSEKKEEGEEEEEKKIEEWPDVLGALKERLLKISPTVDIETPVPIFVFEKK